MLATIADVKGKLGIPSTLTVPNEHIALVLADASEKILQLTRYLELDETGRQEIHRFVQLGQPFRLRKRPVSSVVLEYRHYGSASWNPIDEDVIDAADGLVVAVGTESWPPPIRPVQPARYEILRATFNVVGLDAGEAVGDQLRDACAALAAYWYDRHSGGAAEDQSAGFLSKKYLSAGVPAWIISQLGDHAAAGSTGAQVVT